MPGTHGRRGLPVEDESLLNDDCEPDFVDGGESGLFLAYRRLGDPRTAGEMQTKEAARRWYVVHKWTSLVSTLFVLVA